MSCLNDRNDKKLTFDVDLLHLAFSFLGQVLEYNASDARGQKIIQEMALGIADNKTLSFGSGTAKRVPALTKKAVIIMDEAGR